MSDLNGLTLKLSSHKVALSHNKEICISLPKRSRIQNAVSLSAAWRAHPLVSCYAFYGI